MANLAADGGNSTVLHMWDGQVDINRKREVLKWIVGLITSVLEKHLPRWWNSGTISPCLEGTGVITRMLNSDARQAHVKVLVSGRNGAANVRFEICQFYKSGSGSMIPLEEALKRTEYVLWLYDHADSFLNAARDYLGQSGVEPGGGQVLKERIDTLVRASPSLYGVLGPF